MMTEEQDIAVTKAWGPVIKVCSDEMMATLNRIEAKVLQLKLPLEMAELRPMTMGAFHGIVESFARNVLCRADRNHPGRQWYEYGLERMRMLGDAIENMSKDEIAAKINKAAAAAAATEHVATPVAINVVEAI